MKYDKSHIEKICSFYVNDWHLTTMILPHVNKQIKENVKIITVLENDISKNMEKLLSSMNLKQETQDNILNIKWTSNLKYKYSEMEKYIKNNIGKEEKIEIIVKGTKEYIQIMNKNIIKAVSKINHKTNIEIVNCYEVTEFNNISQILDEHDLILNTAGINKIENIFTEYKRMEN